VKPRNPLISFLLFVSVLVSCHNKQELPEYISGVVIDADYRQPVADALVAIYKHKIVTIGNSYSGLWDTLRTDSNGKFQLDRQAYSNLQDTCNCTFDAKGRGPVEINGPVFYADFSNEVGFNSKTTSIIECVTYTSGYLNIHVIDSEPSNIDYGLVWFELETVGFYMNFEVSPNENYNPNVGLTFGPFLSGQLLKGKISYIDGSGTVHEDEVQQDIIPVGKDTLDVYMAY
jgi:hypothetical protein